MTDPFQESLEIVVNSSVVLNEIEATQTCLNHRIGLPKCKRLLVAQRRLFLML